MTTVPCTCCCSPSRCRHRRPAAVPARCSRCCRSAREPGRAHRARCASMSSFRRTTRRHRSPASSPACAGSIGRPTASASWWSPTTARMPPRRWRAPPAPQVLERHDAAQRGKGYALAVRLRGEPGATTGPTRSSSSMPTARSRPTCSRPSPAASSAARRRCRCTTACSTPQASWRTRLMAIAMACFHRVRSRGPRAAAAVVRAARQRLVRHAPRCCARCRTAPSRSPRTWSTASRSAWPATACTTPTKPSSMR